jgi:glutaminyl-peptide cyclotransferase
MFVRAMSFLRSSWIVAAALAAVSVAACSHDSAPSSAAVNASSPAASAAVAPAQFVIPASDVAPPAAQTGGFDGAKAYDQVAKLVAFGPHPPATDAMHAVQNYIHSQLQSFGCAVDEDDFNAQTGLGTLAMKNIVAKIPGTGQGIIVLLTHYDTKRVYNFVGAEDGGSSTGLMLEMARVLCSRPKQANAVWIAFLDGEETQKEFNWVTPDSVYGSRELAARMSVAGDLKRVRAVILADMVGQYGLRILRDSDAPKWLNDTIWNTAAGLGYLSVFLPQETSTEDDTLPFNERHVPAIDLIDLNDYINLGYWHTTKDTLDKISPRSLAVVGHVILESLSALQSRFR